jgi:hypothetical protein
MPNPAVIRCAIDCDWRFAIADFSRMDQCYPQRTGGTAWECTTLMRNPTSFYFWSGHGLKKTRVGNYQHASKKVYEIAQVQKGHAHRMRDTFAVELLLAGVSIDQVAALLGHSSTRITEKHYSPWVRAAAGATRRGSSGRRSDRTKRRTVNLDICMTKNRERRARSSRALPLSPFKGYRQV